MTTKADLDRLLGTAWHVNGAEFHKRIAHLENAGAPSSVTPDFIGQWLLDTSNSVWYVSHGTSSGNWAMVADDSLSFAELSVLDGIDTTEVTAARITSLAKGLDVEAITSTTSTIAANGHSSIASTASLTYAMASPTGSGELKTITYSVASSLTASTAVALNPSSTAVKFGNGYTSVTFQGNGAVTFRDVSATRWDIVGAQGTIVVA